MADTLDFVVTIIDEPTVNISDAQAIWESVDVSTLSATLDMVVLDAPSPVVATKVTVVNATVSSVVRVECPPGSWGVNGQCEPCAKGTHRPSGADWTGCKECERGTYQPFKGGSECAVCGAGNCIPM